MLPLQQAKTLPPLLLAGDSRQQPKESDAGKRRRRRKTPKKKERVALHPNIVSLLNHKCFLTFARDGADDKTV